MPTTWSTTDKTASGSLSGGNLVFTTGTNSGVRTGDRYSTGKYYFEYTGTTWLNTQTLIGIGTAAAALSSVASTPTAACLVQRNGQVWLNGSSTGMPSLGALTSGAVVCVALDCDTKQVWFRVGAAGNWNANAAYAPGGSGGILLTSISPDSRLLPLYGLASAVAAGDVITANFGGSAFVGAVPAGYTSGLPAPNVPPLYAADTQLSLEQWASPNPQAQLTQLGIEHWGNVVSGARLALLTAIGVEQWAVVPKAGINATLSATLAPATVAARGSIDDDAVDDRITEDVQARVTEPDDDRVIEQALPATLAQVTATLAPATVASTARLEIQTRAQVTAVCGPATVSAFTGRLEIRAYVDGTYYRVLERSPSTPHPQPPGEYLHRITERSGERIPGEIDYRGTKHQLLGGAIVTAFTATLRTRVGEWHYLTARRYRQQVTARSSYKKTRAA